MSERHDELDAGEVPHRRVSGVARDIDEATPAASRVRPSSVRAVSHPFG